MPEKIRRYDLDWLRVLVFAILILYHVGMFFVPWGYHLKNNEISEGLVIPMLLINQWRLPLLFVISGMGTRFALSFRTGREFIRERNLRLLIPLIFGMLVIVPPQVYFERVVQGMDYASFIHFYPDYFNGIYPTGNFSWHHLWFLPYLLVYSIVLTPIFLYIRNNPSAPIINKIKTLIQNPLSLYLFMVPICIVEIYLEPIFPLTRDLISDWYGFTYYILFFFLGFFFIAIKEEFWKSVMKIRSYTLVAGILTFVLFISMKRFSLPHEIAALITTLNTWNWILAILGYGSKYLNRNSKILSYCNEAVYPFYIVHQTITLWVGYYIWDVNMNLWVKFFIMAFLTYLVSWMIFEVIRRISITRTLFGLKKKPLA